MRSRLRALGHPSVGAVVVGLVAVSLLGSGLFAVISDSVSLTGASAESADFVLVEPELDLEIGPITGIEDTNEICTDPDFGVTYTDADTIAAGAASRQLDIGQFYADGGTGNVPSAPIGSYCLRNVSDTTGQLQVQLLTYDSKEVGACDVTEAAVDTSCDDLDQGELGFNQVANIVAVSGDCVTEAFVTLEIDPGTEVGTAKSFGAVPLGPGDYCLISLAVNGTGRAGVTETEWQQVLSDTAEFDLAFNLVEVP